jgi:hypothetical protein
MIFLVAGVAVDSRWISNEVAASVGASLISKYKLWGIKTPDFKNRLDSIAISLAAKGIMPQLDLTHVKKYSFMCALMEGKVSRGGTGAA